MSGFGDRGSVFGQQGDGIWDDGLQPGLVVAVGGQGSEEEQAVAARVGEAAVAEGGAERVSDKDHGGDGG